MSKLPTAPTVILSEYKDKIKPMHFMFKVSNGKNLKVKVESYLLDDNLDKEGFFVAFKFSDSGQHIWFKTRIHMHVSIVQQVPSSVLKEWTVLQKALESVLPMANLIIPDIDSLVKFVQPQLTTSGSREKLDVQSRADLDDLKQQIQLLLINYFLSKVCLVDKMVGQSFAMLTSERKTLVRAGNYFKAKFGGKLTGLRNRVVPPKPLPWLVLQLIQKDWYQRSELPPVEGIFSMDKGIYASVFEPNMLMRESSESSEDLDERPPAPLFPASSLTSTTKAVLKFKRLVEKSNKGWDADTFIQTEPVVARVVSRFFALVLQHEKSFWINYIELQPVTSKTLGEQNPRTMLEEFQICIHQVKFPSGKQRKVKIELSLAQMASLLGIPKKEFLKIVGLLVCRRRLNQTTHRTFTRALSEFFRSRLFTLQALRSTLNLGRRRNQIQEEMGKKIDHNLQASLRTGRNSLLLPQSNLISPEWARQHLHRAGSSAIKVLKGTATYHEAVNAFDPEDYGPEWYIAKTINYRAKIFTHGQSSYSVDRRMQNSIRMKYEFHPGDDAEDDFVVVRIYDFLGQKGLTIKVTDRAKFEQLLPIIFHPNENFRYIMTNFMFAMKKRELMFSGYKSFRREDIYLGAHYSADLKEVKRSLLFDTYNGYLKILNKMETVFVAPVENLGTCIIRAETYFNWHSGDSNKRNKVFVKFVAVPHKTRLAAHKLVLRDTDFMSLVGIEPYKFLGNEKVLISIFSRVFKLLRLEYRGLYRCLVFPGKWVAPQAPFSKILSRKNQNSSLYFKESEDFVEDVIYSRAPVCKVTTKINGKFAILIVRRSVVDGLITIEVYLPQLRRNLWTSLFLNSSNSKYPNLPNLEKILYENLRSAQSVFQIQASGSYSKIPEIKSYQQYHSLMAPAFDGHSQTFNMSIMKPHDLSMTMGMDVTLGAHPQVATASDFNATVLSASAADRFQTQLYWELLLNYLDVEERPRSKLVMRVGNRTVNLLKEVVFYKEVIIAERLVYFQVAAEGRDPRKAIETHEILQYQNLKGLQYFVKVGLVRGVKSASKSKTVFESTEKSDKISFVKAIELLQLKMHREEPINIWKIKHVAYLLCKQLHDIIVVNSKTSVKLKDFILRHRLSELLAPVDRGSSPLHSRLCEETNSSENESFEKMYKTTLVLGVPLHMEIHLSYQKQQLMFLLYNSNARAVSAWKLSIDDVCEVIPYFWQLHALGEFRQLGERLACHYKNQLLVSHLRPPPDTRTE